MLTPVLLDLLQACVRMAADAPADAEKRTPMTVPSVTESEALKLALEHSRALFIYHATQRHTSMNYYFVTLAALVTGQVTLLTHLELWDHRYAGPAMVTALAVIGVFLAVNFKWLDDRNASLVNCDKAAVAELEHRVKKITHTENTDIMARSDAAGDAIAMHKKRYGRTVPRLLWAFHIIFVLGAAIGWWLKG